MNRVTWSELEQLHSNTNNCLLIFVFFCFHGNVIILAISNLLYRNQSLSWFLYIYI